MRWAPLLLVLAPVACSDGPVGSDRWIVWLSTDAPTPYLVDHARIELLDANGGPACSACTRDVAVPTAAAEWPLEIAFDPVGVPAPRIRVRLYRADRVDEGGAPRVLTTIDHVGILPPARGMTDVAVDVHAECIGIPTRLDTRQTCAGDARTVGPEATVPSGRGTPAFLPGSWARARQRTCIEDAAQGTVCVPGGLFILGAAPTGPERYVQLAPVYLDRAEMTVGRLRAILREGKVIGAPALRSSDPGLPTSACTWLGLDDPANDALPVNCVSHAFADAVCTAAGRRLPTEAEWEWTAGNLLRESPMPWSDETKDPCDQADLALAAPGGDVAASACVRGGKGPGLPPVPNPADVTVLGVGGMGGTLAEWVADTFAPYDAPCWSPETVFLNEPRCEGPGPAVVRGSGWADPPGFAAALARRSFPRETLSPGIGFRCTFTSLE